MRDNANFYLKIMSTEISRRKEKDGMKN